jgi:8-oxoguanine deaminase
MRLWIKAPLAILAEGAEGGVVVEGGRIVELVEAGGRPAADVDEVFDASAHVVLPGLINTHQHFFQNLTRAHPLGINKELGPWLAALYPIWQHLEPDMLRLAAQVAMTELLMSGATTVADHHYMFPRGMEHAVDIEFEEAEKLGLRLVVARGATVLGEADGRLPPAGMVEDEDDVLADFERILARYHQRAEGATRQIALAPTALLIVSDRMMVESAKLADRHDCRLHTHLAESADEVDWCLANRGYRTVDWLEEVGWLNPRTWLAHGIHFSTEECERLGRHGVGICHCPTSNALLASGLCRTRELEAAGAPVGLGSDGGASAGAANIMEEVRHAVMINRLHYGDAAGTTHLDALRWATEGSARCLGRSDIGRIAVGKQADFALFKLDELRFSGVQDPIAGLVLSGANHADRVMVGGKWRIVDGRPPGVDIERLMAQHAEAARRLSRTLSI